MVILGNTPEVYFPGCPAEGGGQKVGPGNFRLRIGLQTFKLVENPYGEPSNGF